MSAESRVVEVTSASRELMDQLSLMMRRFGIWLRISEKRKQATNGARIPRTYYVGLIGGQSLRLFHDLIGIDDPAKSKRLSRVAAATTNGNVGGVPVADVLQKARATTGLPWLHLTPTRSYAFDSGNASPAGAERIAQRMRAAAEKGAGERWRGPKGKPAYRSTLESYEKLDKEALLGLADQIEHRARREVQYARVVSVEPVWLEGSSMTLRCPSITTTSQVACSPITPSSRCAWWKRKPGSARSRRLSLSPPRTSCPRQTASAKSSSGGAWSTYRVLPTPGTSPSGYGLGSPAGGSRTSKPSRSSAARKSYCPKRT